MKTKTAVYKTLPENLKEAAITAAAAFDSKHVADYNGKKLADNRAEYIRQALCRAAGKKGVPVAFSKVARAF